MKNLKNITYFLLLFLTSCTITQEFHFNKNFSGSSKMTIDMGTFMNMMAGMDSTGTQGAEMKDSLDFAFNESAQKLEGVGVTNIKYGWQNDNKIMFLSYDFPNIDVLNKALNASDDGNSAFMRAQDEGDHVYFIRKGKTLTYQGIKSKNDTVNMGDMASMKDMYKYKLVFSFDRKVKKLDNPNIALSEDKKRAVLSASLFDVIRPEYNSTIKFKLK